MNFRQYLERAGLAKSNFRRMEILAEGWLVWLSSRQIELAATTYADLLDYVGHLQKQGKSRYVINRTLQTISRYYHHSDKLILGLMIFQGLEMGEIERLELHDLDLEKGVINAPAGRLRLTRKIPLEGRQILPWRRFIEDIRPELLTEPSDKLLAPQADKRQRLHHQLKRLSKRVKVQAKAGPGLTINKLNQLRQSRIAIWVESYGLRKAQYLSGLRRLQSVERYQKQKLEDLQRQIGRHHPLQ
jgi:site-specific recombinase XerD